MIKTIELKNFHMAFIKNSKILLTKEETLGYTLNSNYDLNNMILSLRNGTIEKEVKAENGVFEIPKELLFSGKLESTLRLFNGITLIDFWNIEPLIIQECKDGVNAVPEIETLKEEINTLKNQVNELLEIQRKRDKVRSLFTRGK